MTKFLPWCTHSSGLGPGGMRCGGPAARAGRGDQVAGALPAAVAAPRGGLAQLAADVCTAAQVHKVRSPRKLWYVALLILRIATRGGSIEVTCAAHYVVKGTQMLCHY